MRLFVRRVGYDALRQVSGYDVPVNVVRRPKYSVTVLRNASLPGSRPTPSCAIENVTATGSVVVPGWTINCSSTKFYDVLRKFLEPLGRRVVVDVADYLRTGDPEFDGHSRHVGLKNWVRAEIFPFGLAREEEWSDYGYRSLDLEAGVWPESIFDIFERIVEEPRPGIIPFTFETLNHRRRR